MNWKNLLFDPIHIADIQLSVSILDIFLGMILPFAAAFILASLLKFFARRIVQTLPLAAATANKLFLWIKTTVNILLIAVLALLFARTLQWNIAEQAMRMLTTPFYTSGDSVISVLTILLILPVFYLAILISKYVQRISERSTLQLFIDNDSLRFSVSNILRYACLLLFSIVGMSLIGINLSSLALIFGVLGIGIGFGLQSVVENFFAGVIIVSTRPIKMGDTIEIGETLGTVVQIKLMHTIVSTQLNATLILPNRDLVNSSVHNYSYEDDSSIVLLNTVQVSYDTDLDWVQQLLMEMLNTNPYRHKTAPGPWVRVSSFDSSGISITTVCRIENARDKFDAHSWINLEIWRTFKQHNISIPFPQLDLHMDAPPSSSVVPDTPSEV